MELILEGANSTEFCVATSSVYPRQSCHMRSLTKRVMSVDEDLGEKQGVVKTKLSRKRIHSKDDLAFVSVSQDLVGTVDF